MRGTPTPLPLSVVVLVAANLVPLAGVLLFGWRVIDILWLYWAENVVIGVLNIPRILTARGPSGDHHPPAGWFGAIFTAVFFAFHYGMFTFGHGVFIATLFGEDGTTAEVTFAEVLALLEAPGLRWALLGLFASHTLSLVVNWFRRGERFKHDARMQMFSVYGRIIVLHVVIILGGLGAQAVGEPVAALVLLVALKTFVDVVAHLRSHERLAERGAAPGVFS